jgi:glucose-6-phosphate 1-dehydrogenase
MFESIEKPDPAVFIIFGGAGDLSQRKLAPALYNLLLDDWLPEQFAVVAVSHHERSDEKLRKMLKNGIDNYSRRKPSDNGKWESLAERISYFEADFEDIKAYKNLSDKLDKLDEEFGVNANRIFYMAVSPQYFEPIARNISRAKLADNPNASRLVVEKPFGEDYESARALNKGLGEQFKESQIYRIDHYLGKETVQNIMAFRFANAFFEPLWNQNYIDNVQITVSEKAGIEHRAAYYDQAGALRDMMQNHLMQLLCMVAMEPPVTYEAKEIQNRKVDVLNAVRRYDSPEKVRQNTVRGQYWSGRINGQNLKSYRDSEGVNPKSNTETFAALKIYVDNRRWKGIPFYLRTGKGFKGKNTSIKIQFKAIPHQLFPCEIGKVSSNILTINIQPQMGINLEMQAKKPGLKMQLTPVEMDFDYKNTFTDSSPEAYETLLLDIMRGDSTLFMSADQVEAAWKIMTPILKEWGNTEPDNFPNYEAGSWGPQESVALLARDNRFWLIS